MMNWDDLRIPGPTPVPPAVMEAMQRPMMPHRGSDFRALHQRMNANLKEILRTDSDVFAIPGSGSIGWEAAIVNTLSPGDKVIAFIIGDFGVRFATVAERFGLNVVRVSEESGCAARPDLVRSSLNAHPDARAVLYTHNETSTGVTNPLKDVAPLVRDHGALLFVDAVSSAGAIPIDTDAWDVDILLSGSQKGWMCPPGLSIVAVGDRARLAEQSATYPRSFIDFGAWRKSVAKGDTPATAPLTLYYALDRACELILEEGVDARGRRHADAARETRCALQSAGFELFAEPDVASSTVTAARPPGGIGGARLVEAVRERYDIEVATGQAALADEIIRIGHMGWFEPRDISRAVAAVTACATALTEQSQGS